MVASLCQGVWGSHLVHKVLHHYGGLAVVAAITKVFLVVRLVLDAAKIAHAVDRVRGVVQGRFQRHSISFTHAEAKR